MNNNIIEWVVKDVEYLDNYRLLVKFADEKIKIVDLEDRLKGEYFEPLKDIEEFKKVYPDGLSITWENGLDISPEFLYTIGKETRDDEQIRKIS